MAKRTISKDHVDDLKMRDPNFSFYFDIDAWVFDTLCLEWARIYTIFDNDEFYELNDEASIYQNISNPQFQAKATRPATLQYTNLVKWVIDLENILTITFKETNQMVFINIKPNMFSKIYALKVLQQLLTQEIIKSFDNKIEQKSY